MTETTHSTEPSPLESEGDVDAILETGPLGFPWVTQDPFLFCVHHLDAYPEGNEKMGPKASLEGRNLGMDFEIKDGFRMYHGDVVPGFPQHPHRGFETITIARNGYIDHSDSLGATARFGQGDVQWMTAGKGIVHSEMFPLVRRDGPNPTELFQIWLNLPRADKMVDPYFTMLWSHTVPTHRETTPEGATAEVTLVAGDAFGLAPPPPPPSSWASRPESDLAVWTVKLEPGARVTLPAAKPTSRRTLYYFAGGPLTVGSRTLDKYCAMAVRSEVPIPLSYDAKPGEATAELLVLQGRPLDEPVAHHGPFVMNTQAEIRQAMLDYQRTRFGGWPWKEAGPVHARERGRFALHADGRLEEPTS